MNNSDSSAELLDEEKKYENIVMMSVAEKCDLKYSMKC